MNDTTGAESLYKKSEVISLINSVLHQVAGSESGVDHRVYREMLLLKGMIEGIREEIRTISPHDIMRDHIPGASDELDAVVTLTEQATHGIMNACDEIRSCLHGVPIDRQERISNQLISIFELCTFQDITGQRISKAMSVLKKIDQKMQDIVSILEPHLGSVMDTERVERPVDPQSPESLLNGPQLPGLGITQDDIDRMLKDMDGV